MQLLHWHAQNTIQSFSPTQADETVYTKAYLKSYAFSRIMLLQSVQWHLTQDGTDSFVEQNGNCCASSIRPVLFLHNIEDVSHMKHEAVVIL